MVNVLNSLEQQTLNYLQQEGLPLPDKGYHLLLAASGGVDSTVMTTILGRLGFKISLAHANFQLRGNASDQDQQLVQDQANELHITCHQKAFDTRDYASEKGISLEMAARNLRYAWFRELMQAQGYHYLSTAHHLNDQAETLLLNLTRGTGIKGLTAIQPLKGYTIRPLLFSPKDRLINYAKANNLHWREDESNQQGTHERNQIRHYVIPALKAINPSLEQTIHEDIRHFREIYQVWEQQYQQQWELLCHWKGGFRYLNRAGLTALNPLSPYLFAFFSPFGFNKTQLRQVQEALAHQPGALFYAPDYQLEVARHSLIVAPRELHTKPLTFQAAPSTGYSGGYEFTLLCKKPDSIDLNAPQYAFLDADKIAFPVKLRPWKPGDRFYPLGMTKSKKLSDYFTDEQWPRLEKARALVLETADGQIAWIALSRPDERFKVRSDTRQILAIHYRQVG